MNKEDVLDNGSVQYVDHMGSDLTIVNSARVSFDSESDWVVDEEVESRLKRTNSTFRPSDIY